MKQYGPYGDMITRLQAFKDNVDTIVIEEALKEEDEMIRLNLDEQLAEGIDNTGQPIQPPYTSFTKSIKKAKGQPADRVTLKDTGDFYKGFYNTGIGKKIYTDSKDKKTEKLVTKYGENIFGLTDANLQYFIDSFLRPNLINRFRKALLP